MQHKCIFGRVRVLLNVAECISLPLWDQLVYLKLPTVDRCCLRLQCNQDLIRCLSASYSCIVGCFPHELLCLLSPNCWNCYHPPHISLGTVTVTIKYNKTIPRTRNMQNTDLDQERSFYEQIKM